jgi:hypothetical protein
MPANTYSDGFPLTPLEAIEFSYFLSEAEKQEWREWLQTATMEQQNELVDILHSMWQDNQKQAVPAAFTNNVAQQPLQAQPQNPVQQPSFPDTSFTNEVFTPQVSQPQPVAQTQVQNTIPLDNSFAADNSFNTDQFQFVTEQSTPQAAPVMPQVTPPVPVTQPQPVAQSQSPFQTQPPVADDSGFTFIEPQENVAPQFQNDFQSPDLSIPQVQAPVQPQPTPQVTQPNITQTIPSAVQLGQNDDEEEEEDDEDEMEDEHPLSQPIHDDSGEGQEVALKKMASTKYKPNPILDDKTPPLEEFVYKNGATNSQKSSDKPENPQPKKDNREPRENRDNRDNRDREPRENRNDSRDNREPKENRESRDNRDNRDREPKGKPPVTDEKKKAFFGSSELREASSKSLLDEVYKAYQDSRNKNAVSTKELDDKFTGLLDRVMQVISTSGQLADYYETIIEKIIEVNDRVVEQAKEIQLLKNNTQSRGGVSLQDQVDEIRDDIERLNRDTRTMRIEQRKKYDEITSQMASSDADAFSKDGLIHRIDLLKSDIVQLQQKLGVSDQKPNPMSARLDQNNSVNQSQPRRQNTPGQITPRPPTSNFDNQTL